MAVLPSSLIAPNGPVEPNMFPGEVTDGNTAELEARLQSYISKGILKATSDGLVEGNRDEAVENWALYLAFQAAHTLFAIRPAVEDAQMALLGRTEYDEDQRDILEKRAEQYKTAYFDYLDTVVTGGGPMSKGVSTRQTRTEYDW